MGFPPWTLWGMGLSAIGALLALGLALIGQSPGLLKRIGLSGSRLDLRVRAFTGYALALLLLAIGFFLAGVPLNSQPVADEVAGQSIATPSLPPETASTDSVETDLSSVSADMTEPANIPLTPETGAFGGPPSRAPATEQEADSEGSTTSSTPEATSEVSSDADETPSPSSTPQSTATQTPTPTPTETSTPTLEPTPILDQTGVVVTAGGTIWLRRSPGGQNLVLMHNGDLVVLLPGHANEGGALWREVSTTAGVAGWMPEEFLDY